MDKNKRTEHALRERGDTTYYNDDSVCAAYSARTGRFKNKETNFSSFIVPNPAKDLATLYYQIPRDIKCELIIYDVYGKKISQIKLPVNSVSFSIKISGCSNALYNYRINSPGSIISTGRFAVIK